MATDLRYKWSCTQNSGLCDFGLAGNFGAFTVGFVAHLSCTDLDHGGAKAWPCLVDLQRWGVSGPKLRPKQQAEHHAKLIEGLGWSVFRSPVFAPIWDQGCFRILTVCAYHSNVVVSL